MFIPGMTALMLMLSIFLDGADLQFSITQKRSTTKMIGLKLSACNRSCVTHLLPPPALNLSITPLQSRVYRVYKMSLSLLTKCEDIINFIL